MLCYINVLKPPSGIHNPLQFFILLCSCWVKRINCYWDKYVSHWVHEVPLLFDRSCPILQAHYCSRKGPNSIGNHFTYAPEASKQFIFRYVNPKDFHWLLSLIVTLSYSECQVQQTSFQEVANCDSIWKFRLISFCYWS